MKNLDRRKFIKKSSLSAAGLVASSLLGTASNPENITPSEGTYMGDFAAEKIPNIRA